MQIVEFSDIGNDEVSRPEAIYFLLRKGNHHDRERAENSPTVPNENAVWPRTNRFLANMLVWFPTFVTVVE